MATRDPRKKRAWVWGAGFSRPLGGPLITDLLAYRERVVVEAALPARLADTSPDHVPESMAVREICAYGVNQRYWQHAEEFLATVEAAAEAEGKRDCHALRLVRAMLSGIVVWLLSGQSSNVGEALFPTVESLCKAVRRAVIADCWSFLRGADLDGEGWRPYLNWADRLNRNDTILTFNYDDVPELIQARLPKLLIVTPRNIGEQQTRVRTTGQIPVLKLHGSTSWTLNELDEFETSNKPGGTPPALFAPSNVPMMGFPGPGKLQGCQTQFRGLWDIAMAAVQGSHEITFIGYRFPATDVYSLHSLLQAIRNNRQVERVEVVLGTSVGQDVERMRALLSTAVSPSRIKVTPYGSAEFLALYGLEDEREDDEGH